LLPAGAILVGVIGTPNRLTASRPLCRSRDGRWLGGVCIGLASARGVSAGWIRVAFVVATLLAGLGAVVYLACWLIMPSCEDVAAAHGPRGIVALAQVCAAGAGLATLALMSAAATVFGFGWVVVLVAATVLLGVLFRFDRLGPAWALLPTAALALPAVAVATSSLRLTPQFGAIMFDPARVAQLRSSTYRSGLGTMLIDLRSLKLPRGGVVPLRIVAGVRRTIVALPQDRCVHVVVHHDVHPFAADFAAVLTNRSAPSPNVDLFGRIYETNTTTAAVSSPVPGPVLMIDFSSQGGGLYVRDYPTSVNPEGQPDWPGFPVHPEQRPDTKGMPPKAAAGLLRDWRRRLVGELASQRQIDGLMRGPCAPPARPLANSSERIAATRKAIRRKAGARNAATRLAAAKGRVRR
jgi:phage shock protein PspC (stress-responsive transcriptional regulator)